MHLTKFKYENKPRAITQKLSKQELRIMCTALPLDEIYPPLKFHNHSYCSFGDMLKTKFENENKQRARTQELTHSHTMTPFDAPGKQAFLKTLWVKEKLLVTSNFSFSHCVFYLFGYFSAIFVKFDIVVCKLFQFGRV